MVHGARNQPGARSWIIVEIYLPDILGEPHNTLFIFQRAHHRFRRARGICQEGKPFWMVNTELSLAQQLGVVAIAMLTSKGASGVTGAAVATLAATLAVFPTVPLAGLVLILGIAAPFHSAGLAVGPKDLGSMSILLSRPADLRKRLSAGKTRAFDQPSSPVCSRAANEHLQLWRQSRLASPAEYP
jgi:hypothetical protein